MHFANNYALTAVDENSEYRIYLLLTDYPDRISRLIKTLGFWKYSHVSLSTSLIESDFYSYVGKKGFRVEKPLEHPTYKGRPVDCVLMSIPVTKEVCEEATTCISRHIAIARTYKYSYFGLIMIYFGISARLKRRYTCTGFVSEILHKSGGFGHRKYRRLLKPDDFYNKFQKYVLFKGTLENMLLQLKTPQSTSV